MALIDIPPGTLTVLAVIAGAVGVAYYAYSSHRIGATFGMASVPYGAVYATLLVTAFTPAAASIDRPVAIIMSLVALALYTAALMRSKAVRGHVSVRVAAVGIGFIALVVFPLFSPPNLELVLAVLYRGSAVAGWVSGARPGLGPAKGPKR